MKMRVGFVSNSSSTAFILDLRDEGVQQLVKDNEDLGLPSGLDRRTALAVGEDAVQYGNEWVGSWGEWDFGGPELGYWILGWALKLGAENIVFARESDEGMGGSFYNGRQLNELAIDEMEYH